MIPGSVFFIPKNETLWSPSGGAALGMTRCESLALLVAHGNEKWDNRQHLYVVTCGVYAAIYLYGKVVLAWDDDADRQ